MSVHLSRESIVSASIPYFTFLPLSALLLTPRLRFMGASMYVLSVPRYFKFGLTSYQTHIHEKFPSSRDMKIQPILAMVEP